MRKIRLPFIREIEMYRHQDNKGRFTRWTYCVYQRRRCYQFPFRFKVEQTVNFIYVAGVA